MIELTTFHADIKSILELARGKARSAVNSAMVEAYWLIGQRIVQEEQQGKARAAYGQRLLENLSKELSESFGKGFSYANLRNFRQFYLTYPDQAICYTLCSKLSWSHNRLIMRVDAPQARNHYLAEAAAQQWSVRQLECNIETHSIQMLMHNPPHPGAFIQEIYLGPSNYSGRELALALGVAASTLNRLLLGQSGVSPEMALRLSKALGRSPESWLAMQDQYDLWQARQTLDLNGVQRMAFA